MTTSKLAISITGILTPLQWDRNGNVITAGISTADEKEYVIADESLTPALLKLLRQLVRARGELLESAENQHVLVLNNCVSVRQLGNWNKTGVPEDDRRAVTDGDWYPLSNRQNKSGEWRSKQVRPR